MNSYKYLIIGGGIAGTTAAETIRAKDSKGSIAIVSDEKNRLYSRIMLSKPNFFLEKIPFDHVWLKDEVWYKEKKVELILGRTATELRSGDSIIVLDGGDEIKYEKLLLAIGGCTRGLPVKGADKKGVYSLRLLSDAKAIIKRVKESKTAVSIGGGFISFEMCDMLMLAGLDVTLLLRESYFWEPILDEESGKMIEHALEKNGIRILRNTEAKEIKGGEYVENIELKNGEEIPCDILIAGIGIVCKNAWIGSGGVEIGRGVAANKYLETNIPNVYVAGDCAEYEDVIIGEKVQLGNWIHAQMQGRTAGENMTGEKKPYKTVSFYTTQGFGITIGFVGDVKVVNGRRVITRGSAKENSYARLIIKDNEIVGGTFINRTQELGIVRKLIESDVNVEGKDDKLMDENFNLSDLLK